MAAVQIVDGMLEVRLGFWERIGAVHGNIAVPLSAVRAAYIVDRPFAALRGIRWPGTGIPGVVALGTWRWGGGRDFVALFGRQRAVEIELAGCEFDRLLIGAPDPESVIGAISRVTR
jgi:hypothetical protein